MASDLELRRSLVKRIPARCHLSLVAQVDGRHRRDGQEDGLIAVMPLDILRLDLALILDTAAAEGLIIRVEHLDVTALLRHADAVIVADLRREVADGDDVVGRVLRLADEGDDAVLVVVAIDPLEAIPVEVDLPERLVVAVELVERAAVLEHLLVHRILLRQMPVEAVIVIPLDELAELTTHEQQLLAWMCDPVREERAQAGKLLPVIARHLADQRTLAVHDLIVRERQHEVLAERIHEGERDLVVVPLAVDRVERHVLEHVVHPAHVPLVVEAHAPHVDRLRDQRPGRRFLGNHQGLRMVLEDALIEFLEEVHGLEVARVAVLVRRPLAVLAAIVEVEHIRDCIDAQTVDVELLEPEHRVRDQEALDLRAAVVEVCRAPLPVLGKLLVVGLVERLAIEVAQALLILAEMARDPVHDDGDAVLMRLVHEIAEVVRCAEATRHGVITRDLVAPRAIEGMLTERHELDVRVVHLLDVVDELIREVAIGQVLSILRAAPGACMHFIRQHRALIG